ncbi:MAG: 2-amino-4-hydroxy-6-hydroxymethyldihydropteridine diphosphokinase, partial [Planctomycetia bacterium]
MARCLVGCGSNVGNRRDYLDQALELLRYMPGVTLESVSRYRDTRPIGGPPGQPAFLNAACLLETDLAPHDVLGMLAAVENTLHRERSERWGPRTVDLDLLLYEDVILDTERLTLPHPRMVTRRFVLEPCVEIAADFVHPLADCRLDCLLESISSAHPHVAVVGVPGSGADLVAAAIADATLARLVHAPAEYAMVGGMTPRPETLRGEPSWLRAVEACAGPLAAAEWPQDPHGTVADYWLPTLRLAAADALAAGPFGAFEPRCAEVAATTVPPQVAILLVVSAEVLEERIAFRSRQSGGHSDTFADLPIAAADSPAIGGTLGTAVCTNVEELVARSLLLQDRLITALRGRNPVDALRPAAVVTIAAEDLGQAVGEAV